MNKREKKFNLKSIAYCENLPLRRLRNLRFIRIIPKKPNFLPNLLVLIASILIAQVGLVGCATSRKFDTSHYSTDAVLRHICEIGKNVQSVRGRARLKVQSPEISGQFFGNIVVDSPDEMKIEITNLFGGTEAIIEVTGQNYRVSRIKDGGGMQSVRSGSSWGGIPLKWAIGLFLGKVPCPSLKSIYQENFDSEGRLIIRTKGKKPGSFEEYAFLLKEEDGAPWPSALAWKIVGAPDSFVELQFDSPDKWDAKAKQGSISVRWRDRKITENQGSRVN